MGQALVAGRDYPNTYRKFVGMFPDVQACTAYLMWMRWPEGFICPSCGVTYTPWNQSRHRLVCPDCRQQTTELWTSIY